MFDEKSFFNTLLGFTPLWVYKPTDAIHADSTGVYTNTKVLYLKTRKKIHLKCNVIESSIQIGLRQPIIFSFILDKKPGHKVFCQPKTVHYKKK